MESSSVRLALVVVVAVKIVGLVLIFDPTSALAFEGPKSTFSVALALITLGLVYVALARFGSWHVFRTPLHLAVAAFAVSNVLAVVFAQDQYIALFGAQRRLGLTFIADMLVLYLAVAFAYRTSRDWAILSGAVAIAGTLAIGYGLIQYLGLDPMRWVDEVRVRPPSTFGNPDKFGHFLGATCMTALAVAVLPGDQGRRIRAVAGLYAAASLGAAALVATRGSLVGLFFALPVLGAVYLRLAQGRAGRRLLLAAGGTTLGLVVIGGALLLATPLGDRVRAGFGDAASQQRLFLADAAMRAFIDRPLTGHGPDNFGVVYPFYRPAAASPFVGQDSAHSSVLQAMATTGLIGAVSLVAVALASLIMLWRALHLRATVAGPLLVGGVAYWASGLVAIGSVSVDWIGWVAAGGAAALGSRIEGTAARRVSPVFQVAILVIAVMSAGWVYPALQANRELYIARTARSADRALPAADRAISLDSGRAEYWFALGLARRERGEWGKAAQAFRAASERAPHVPAYWSNLALAQANLVLSGDQSFGGQDVALSAARRAIDADRGFPGSYHVLALVSKSFGDHAGALRASEAAIRLYKGEPEYESVAADAALRLQDGAAARVALERIVQEKDAPVLRVALARISLNLRDPGSARSHLRRALELDPQNAPARELMQQMGGL